MKTDNNRAAFVPAVIAAKIAAIAPRARGWPELLFDPTMNDYGHLRGASSYARSQRSSPPVASNSETGTGPNPQRHCAHACASCGALPLSLLQAVHRQVSQTDSAMRRTESNRNAEIYTEAVSEF